MRRKRLALLCILAVLTALVCVGLERRDGSVPPTPSPTAEAPRLSLPRAADVAPTSAPRAVEETRDANVEAIASLAAAAGFGWIDCALPSGLPDDLVGLETDPLSQGPYPFALGTDTRIGDRFTTLVSEPSGVAHLALPRPDPALLRVDMQAYEAELLASNAPQVTIEWGDAWPGERGWCRTKPPRRVVLSGIVTSPEGEPLEGVSVQGCNERMVETGPDGSFSREVWAGFPCELRVDFRAALLVDTRSDRHGLVLVHDPDAPYTPVDWHQRWTEEMTRLEYALYVMPDPFDLALEDNQLSEAARERLEAWRDAHRAEAERILSSKADGIEQLEARGTAP